uniref:Genome polyprotein n=1 Tax=Leucocoprinus gammaflexivirus D TaxID=2592760 RepID=A0A7G3KIJ4_9VIRU|nr:putative MP [Leucocoprinus gammaflexivirus D]
MSLSSGMLWPSMVYHIKLVSTLKRSLPFLTLSPLNTMNPTIDPWYRRTQTLISQLREYESTPVMNPHRTARLIRIPITRRDYSALNKIVHDPYNIYTITGPTGCGKSTFALLKIMPGRRTIIVCPSKANAANLLTEFNKRIPDTMRKLKIKGYCPKATLVNFQATWFYETPLLIMTAATFVHFVSTHRAFPPCDLLIHDEYHLQNRFSTETRMIMDNCRSTFPGNNPTMILVSATPPDEPVPPPRTSGITTVLCDIPDIMTRPVPDIYRRSKHLKYSNNYLLIVADSCESAHRLETALRNLGEEVFCACACPSPATVDIFLRHITSNYTVICTPDTESGMTFPCSHMVNPGTSVTALFQDRIVIQKSITLSRAQAAQRAGRAGRSGHTILFTAPLPDTAPPIIVNPIVLGSAYLLVLSLTHHHPTSNEALFATHTFPRLLNCSVRAAQECLLSHPALIGLYKVDNEGTVYSEFGGSATTFATDNANDLTLFKWPGGSAYAPFLNTLAEHDLTKGMTPESIRSITEQIAMTRNLPVGALPDALAAASREPEIFAPYLWSAFEQLAGPSNLSRDVSPTAPLSDFAGTNRCQLEYMLTPMGAQAWRILERLGGTFKLTTERFLKGSTNPQQKVLDHAKDYCHRTFTFRNASIHYSSDPLLGDDNKVSPSKVENLLLVALRPVLITHSALQQPGISVDLLDHLHNLTRTNNPWLSKLLALNLA